MGYGAPVQVPGPDRANFLKRTFTPDPKGASDNVFLYFEVPGNYISVSGVLINNHYLAHNGPRGSQFQLNLTPWVRRGSENTLTLIHAGATLKTIELRYYALGKYP